MNYLYEAIDSTGQTVMGRLDADNDIEARRRLQQMGYRPQAIAPNPASTIMDPPASGGLTAAQQHQTITVPHKNSIAVGGVSHVATQTAQTRSASSVILAGSAAKTGSGALRTAAPADNRSSLGGVIDSDRLLFFQQLAALVKSGMTIHAALDNLGPRTQNANLVRVAREMCDAARNGDRVSDVMERYPVIFEEHIVGLVRAGEMGGFLDIALSEIALTYEQNIALFRGSWIPKLMATQAIYALALAIPLFPDIIGHYDLDHGAGPGIRLYLLHEAILMPTAFLITLACKVGWKRMQLPAMRRLRDSLILKMPPFGDVHRQAALSSFIRMLRKLYHAGLAPQAAWAGATHTAGNVVIRDRLVHSFDMMTRGATLSDAFTATGLFNNNIEQLVITGQASGQVVESLDNIAAYYQDQLDESVKRAKLGLTRAGILVLMILGGITICWAARSYFDAMFNFGGKMTE